VNTVSLKKWMVQPESANEADDSEIGALPAARATFLGDSALHILYEAFDYVRVD
jgi:hypothetical protein